MKKIFYTILSLSPALTLAADSSFNTGYFTNIITGIKTVVSGLIPVAFGVAILSFFWSIGKYIRNAGAKPEDAKKAKDGIVWSLVAIVVMASVWGIVAFIGGIFGFDPKTSNVNPPTITGLP